MCTHLGINLHQYYSNIMEREQVVRKVILNLKMAGLIDPLYSSDVKPFLEQIWVAGWEYRGKQLTAHNKKQVAQYNSEGNFIASYESVQNASKITGHKTDAIYKSIWKGRLTKKGHYWRYVNDEVPVYNGKAG